MLTPKQLKNYDFQNVSRNAYKASDVDAYMEEVYASYEEMFRENAKLVRELQGAAAAIAKYREDEKNIQNALIDAQRMKAAIVSEAQQQAKEQLASTEERVIEVRSHIDEKSDEMMAEAKEKANEVIKAAEIEAQELMNSAKLAAEDAVKQINDLYESQVKNLQAESYKHQKYLTKVQEESYRIRQEMLGLCQNQIELLSYNPEFVTSDDLDSDAEDSLNISEKMLHEVISDWNAIEEICSGRTEDIATASAETIERVMDEADESARDFSEQVEEFNGKDEDVVEETESLEQEAEEVEEAIDDNGLEEETEIPEETGYTEPGKNDDKDRFRSIFGGRKN